MKGQGVKAKQGRGEQSQTLMPFLSPQRKRSTKAITVGLERSLFICKESFLKGTALDLFLNYVLLVLFVDTVNMTDCSANE